MDGRTASFEKHAVPGSGKQFPHPCQEEQKGLARSPAAGVGSSTSREDLRKASESDANYAAVSEGKSPRRAVATLAWVSQISSTERSMSWAT
jgi:hypothetical protein